MAHPLKKPISREMSVTVFSKGKHRPVILTISPLNIIELRLKGENRSYSLAVDGLFDLAVKDTLMAEKKTVKKRH